MRGLFAGLAALLGVAACGTAITVTVPPLSEGGLAALGGATTAPRGTERLYSPAPHAFQFVTEPVRRGDRAERFELRDAECGGSDCGSYRARAQVTQVRDGATARLDRDAWYGWSFLNGSIGGVTRDTYLGTVLNEWKLEGDQPALFRIMQVAPEEQGWASCDPAVCTVAGVPSDDVVVSLDEVAQSLGWGARQNDGRICRLWNMEASRGAWVDVVVNTNFGTDGSGYLRVWVNDELRCNYLGPLVSPERSRTPVAGPTHRRGIFESFTRRWARNFGAVPRPTLVAFFDEFTEGRSRGEVDVRMREARRGPAFD